MKTAATLRRAAHTVRGLSRLLFLAVLLALDSLAADSQPTVFLPKKIIASQVASRHGAEAVVIADGAVRALRLQIGGGFRLDPMELRGTTHLTFRIAPVAVGSFELETRLDADDGPLLGRILVAPLRADELLFGETTLPISAPAGVHALHFLARRSEKPIFNVVVAPPADRRILDLDWIDFRSDPLPTAARAKPSQHPRLKILLIASEIDHQWMAHMYTAVVESLAAELNLRSDVEAVVSPDFGWPRDPALLEGVRAVVMYSGPAGDPLMGDHGEAFAHLMREGVGFTAIHFSTVAKLLGNRFQDALGGWWLNGPDGLALGPVDWDYLQPDSPITRDLGPVHMNDEIYRRPRLHPQAQPLIAVTIKGRTDTVAWTFERPDGGRSFGTTLGHPWSNWQDKTFRRMVLNGILWTTEGKPRAGSGGR